AHVRIRARELLRRGGRIASEDEQRRVRRIAERAGEQQQAAIVRLAHPLQVRLPKRHPPILEVWHHVVGEREQPHQHVTERGIASMLARLGSYHGGSFSERPSADTSSSAVNPGAIVATSNSTPP